MEISGNIWLTRSQREGGQGAARYKGGLEQKTLSYLRGIQRPPPKLSPLNFEGLHVRSEFCFDVSLNIERHQCKPLEGTPAGNSEIW